MKSYAALWGLGLVLFILGVAIPLAGGSEAFTLLIVVGFALGVAGFFSFVRRDQGTPAA